MKVCEKCGQQVDDKAVVCVNCGCSLAKKTPIFKKWWFWTVIVVLVIAIIAGSSGDGESNTTTGTNNTDTSTNQIADNKEENNETKVEDKFSGDCGITATAEMGSSIINMPTLNVSISNTSEKEISAIKFYFVPLDVYGEEIKGWTSQNYLYTDEAISAGNSNSIEYQFIEDSVKKGKLYVYSVYFADGTEWGNKDATKSTILKKGACITVDGVS